jgi:hypothetical protein
MRAFVFSGIRFAGSVQAAHGRVSDKASLASLIGKRRRGEETEHWASSAQKKNEYK